MKKIKMSREVFLNIFQLKIPLPGLPLKHLNAYLLKGENKNILVDTGLDCEESFNSLIGQLNEIKVKPKDLTDILLTHFHIDHVGLVLRLKRISPKIRILLHKKEMLISKETSNFSRFLEKIKLFHLANGMPKKIIDELTKNHPAFTYLPIYKEISGSSITLEDGEEIVVGNYCFRVVWTPGHSPGHICLYEPKIRLLISGDHLLPTITPNIFPLTENLNPLKDYFESLEKVEKLEVDVVLPAHEDIFTSFKERISQLKKHHEQRSKEILKKLSGKELSAYELASKISWDINYGSWEELPLFQKYLAVGETLAHLKLLEEKNLVGKVRKNQTIIYYVKKNKK